MVNSDTKIISQDIIYESPFFRVAKRVVERNGKQYTKDLILRRDVVYVLPMTDDGQIIMEKQYRDALGKVSLEVVAGHIDDGEDPLATAKRELSEETGFTADHWEQFALFDQGANFSGKGYAFLAKGLHAGEPHLEEDELVETITMPFKEAIAKTLTGEISVASHVAALQIYNTKQNNG